MSIIWKIPLQHQPFLLLSLKQDLYEPESGKEKQRSIKTSIIFCMSESLQHFVLSISQYSIHKYLYKAGLSQFISSRNYWFFKVKFQLTLTLSHFRPEYSLFLLFGLILLQTLPAVKTPSIAKLTRNSQLIASETQNYDLLLI